MAAPRPRRGDGEAESAERSVATKWARGRHVSVTAVVDFGSSHTVTVVHAPGGVPRVVNVDGEPYLPSAVFLTGDDSLVVGHDALQMAAVDPSRLESRAK